MSSDDIETGYTLGGGLEWAFTPTWSLKTEYLYVDLGDQTLSGSGPAGTYTSRTESDFHTARIGLNYKF
jgi:outer membrane immunogenic protein